MVQQRTKLSIKEAHQYFAAKLNNKVWDLLQKENRTEQETADMENSAHASMYHWKQLKNPVDEQRGMWLLSRVYAAQNKAKRALSYAKKCVDLAKKHPSVEFNIAFAYEAMGRAFLANHNLDEAHCYKELAIDCADEINNPKQRNAFLQTLFNVCT